MLLGRHGWRDGMPRVRAQLRRCGSDYTLVHLQDGAVALLTVDGVQFDGTELAAWVVRPVSLRCVTDQTESYSMVDQTSNS